MDDLIQHIKMQQAFEEAIPKMVGIPSSLQGRVMVYGTGGEDKVSDWNKIFKDVERG